MSYWAIMNQPMFAASVSFLIGFGMAVMFRPLCKGAECVVVYGPPVKDVVDKVYQMGERCVEFTTEVTECPSAESGQEVVKTVSRVASL
jgi:hypothetical protein